MIPWDVEDSTLSHESAVEKPLHAKGVKFPVQVVINLKSKSCQKDWLCPHRRDGPSEPAVARLFLSAVGGGGDLNGTGVRCSKAGQAIEKKGGFGLSSGW